MLPKNSASRTYLISNALRTLKSEVLSLEQSDKESERSQAVEEKSRVAAAAKKTAEKMAETAARKSGARTSAEKEAVRRRHVRKNERVTTGFDYAKMVMEPNTNNTTKQLEYWDIVLNAAATASYEATQGKRFAKQLVQVGSKNRSLGREKAESQCRRWSSFSLED